MIFHSIQKGSEPSYNPVSHGSWLQNTSFFANANHLHSLHKPLKREQIAQHLDDHVETDKFYGFHFMTTYIVCTYIQKKMKKSQTQLLTPSHRLIFIADVRGFSENQMRAKPLRKLHFAVEAERNKNKRAKRILLKYKRYYARFFWNDE